MYNCIVFNGHNDVDLTKLMINGNKIFLKNPSRTMLKSISHMNCDNVYIYYKNLNLLNYANKFDIARINTFIDNNSYNSDLYNNIIDICNKHNYSCEHNIKEINIEKYKKYYICIPISRSKTINKYSKDILSYLLFFVLALFIILLFHIYE